MIKFTQEQIAKIVNLYQSGISSSQIAKEYSVSKHTILRLLKKQNVKILTQKECQQKSLTKKQEENLCQNYISGMKLQQLSNKYNISKETARKYLIKNNIERIKKIILQDKKNICQDYLSGIAGTKLIKKYNIPKTNLYRLLRKNNIDIIPENRKWYKLKNENMFEEIDTQEKAYILGFLYADGCNYNNLIIVLSLQKDDREILEKISKYIFKSKRPLIFDKSKNKKWKDKYALNICGQKISSDFSKLGVVPRKTLKIKLPTFLEEKFISHFIRGYFDGDGCLTINKKNQGCISIAGTYDLCSNIQNIILELDINSRIKLVGKISVLEFNGNLQVRKFLEWLYRDANLYMNRKYKKYQELIKIHEQIRRY